MKLSKIAPEIAIVASVCVPLALTFVLPVFYHPVPKDPSPRTFSATIWQTAENRQVRFAMLDDLKQRHKLIGMTAPEVYWLLGKPDVEVSKDEELSIDYSIQYDMGAVGKDSATTLYIHFKRGHVDKMEVFRS